MQRSGIRDEFHGCSPDFISSGLPSYDSIRNVTNTDWRLPTTLQPDPGCGSQLDAGSTYGLQGYGLQLHRQRNGPPVLHRTGWGCRCRIPTTHNSNYDLFSNVQSNYMGPVRSTRPIPASRGTSIPATATVTSTVRPVVTTRWLFAQVMSPLPPCQSRRR
jgi:hypothetical protein